jgi:hypothetical protein
MAEEEQETESLIEEEGKKADSKKKENTMNKTIMSLVVLASVIESYLIYSNLNITNQTTKIITAFCLLFVVITVNKVIVCQIEEYIKNS